MNTGDFSTGSPLDFALLSVESLDSSIAFYRDRIGLSPSAIAELPEFAAGFTEGPGLAARAALCEEPGTPAGRILLVEFAGARDTRVRLPGDRTTRGLWNLNFYVDDIHAVSQALGAAGFEFWSEPVTYPVGATAGMATEVVFEGPDGVAINLVEPRGRPDTFTGRVRAAVAEHGKTRTGFTPVATTAHCVRNIAEASAFYRDVLGMQVVLDETLGRPETNHFLARPRDARVHTMFFAGAHFFGKIALNEPQNFVVPERVERARSPAVGYLAQGFVVPSLKRAAQLLTGTEIRQLEFTGVPGLSDGPVLQVAMPGSGALALLREAL
jgi:catechol 2,3-dioxygenase-like lactoylglutathione lyase family enzyme